MSGKLIVCATPIGNLGDITLRVLEVLADVDIILAEDTRVTSKILSRFKISTRLERCDDNVIRTKTPQLLQRISEGEKMALVSDAGTPGISDPGSSLVAAALDEGIDVEVLPGANAVITALVASGLPSDAFYFGGFLPKKRAEKISRLDRLASLDATLLFYESPHRLVATLTELAELFPARQGAVARELTKLHEEVARGTFSELQQVFGERDSVKGEIVLLIGPEPHKEFCEEDLDEEAFSLRVEELRQEGLAGSAIAKQVAGEFGMSKNAAYKRIHG